MTLHNNTDFSKESFRICPKTTLKFYKLTIVRTLPNKTMIQIKLVGMVINFLCTKLDLPE
jgi:hypothetical protein